MSLNLGAVYAEARLDTQDFSKGAGEIGKDSKAVRAALEDTLNDALIKKLGEAMDVPAERIKHALAGMLTDATKTTSGLSKIVAGANANLGTLGKNSATGLTGIVSAAGAAGNAIKNLGGTGKLLEGLAGQARGVTSALSGIGNIALGNIIADGASKAVGAIGSIPKELLSTRAQVEDNAIGMRVALENTAKAIVPSYQDMAKAINEAISDEARKVANIAEAMANDVADHATAAVRSLRDATEAADNANRARAEVGQRSTRQGEDNTIQEIQRRDDARTESLKREKDYTKASEELSIGHARAVRNSSEAAAKADESYQRTVGDARDAAAKATEDSNRKFAQASTDINKSMRRATEDFQRELQQRDSNYADLVNGLAAQHEQTISDVQRAVNETIENGLQTQRAATEQESQAMTALLADQLSQIAQFSRNLEDLASKQADNASGQFESVRVAHERSQEDFRNAIQDQDQKLQDQNGTIEQNLAERLASAALIEDTAKRQVAIDKAQSDAAQERAKLEADIAREKAKVNLESQREAEDFGKRQAAQTAEDQARAGRDAEERQRIIQTHALAMAAIQQRTQAIKATSGQVAEQAERENARAGAAAALRIAQENVAYNNQSALLAKKYAVDSDNARRSYQRTMADLRDALQRAAEDRAREQEEIRKNLEKQEKEAKRVLDAETKARKQATDDEIADFTRKQKETRDNRAQQTADAEKQFKRQEDAANLRSKRESEDVKQALAEIARSYDQTITRIDEQWSDSEQSFARNQKKLAQEAEDAQKALTKATETATQEQEGRLLPLALKWSEAWVQNANRIQAATGRKMRFTVTTNFEEQQKQLTAFVEELGEKLPGTTQDAISAFQKLMSFGIDPLRTGVKDTTTTMIELIAGMALGPGVAGGIDQIVGAMGSGATGQMGEFNQRLRDAGFNISTLPGITKTASGEIKGSIKTIFDAVQDGLGPQSKRLIDAYEGSWKQLTSNLGDVFTRFKAITGESLFNESKKAIGDFNVFLKDNQDTVKTIAETIGGAFGSVVRNISDGAKLIFTPDMLSSFGGLIGSLGNLKDAVFGLADPIQRGLFGGKTFVEAMGLNLPAGNEGNVLKDTVTNLRDMANGLADIAKSDEFRAQVEKYWHELGTFLGIVRDAILESKNLRERFDDFKNSDAGVTIQKLAENTGKLVDEILKGVKAITDFNDAFANNPFLKGGGVSGAVGRFLFGDNPDDFAQRSAEGADSIEALNTGMRVAAARAEGADKALGSLPPALNDVASSADDAGAALEGMAPNATKVKEALDDATASIPAWADEVNGELSHALDDVPGTIAGQLADLKTTIDDGLHEIHGSGILVPWIDSAHFALVSGITAMFDEAGAAATGLASAVGDEMSAMMTEVTIAVDSLDEASNEIIADLNNVKKAASQNATGGAGAGAGGGGAGFGTGFGNNVTNPDLENERIRQEDAKRQKELVEAHDKQRAEDEKAAQEAEAKRKAEQDAWDKLRNSIGGGDSRGLAGLDGASEQAGALANQAQDAAAAYSGMGSALDTGLAAQQRITDQTSAQLDNAQNTFNVYAEMQRLQLLGGSQLSQLSPEAQAALAAAMGQAGGAQIPGSEALLGAATSLQGAAETLAAVQPSAGDTSTSVRTGNITVNDAGQGFMGEFVAGMGDQLHV